MSEAPAETNTGSEGAEGAKEEPPADFLPQGDAAFGALMDALAPEGDGEAAAEGGAQTDAAAGGDGSAAPAAEGAAPAADDAAGKAAGAGGEQAVPGKADEAGTAAGDGAGDGAAAAADGGAAADTGGGDRPAEWTASAAELTPKLGELSTKLEDTIARSHHEAALAEVQEEHESYFDALKQHPRMLVGQEVPKLNGDGMETLRDAADAAEWQEGVKTLLVEEVRDRASRALEESSELLTTMHASIELFQNNADLVPGTKEFDVELANKFADFMEEFELRDDDKKLLGYSVPVQPIINKLRSELVATRAAAKPEAPAASASSNDTKPPAQQASKEDPPQAGIQSKAGNSADDDNWQEALFGTLGLPNLRI